LFFKNLRLKKLNKLYVDCLTILLSQDSKTVVQMRIDYDSAEPPSIRKLPVKESLKLEKMELVECESDYFNGWLCQAKFPQLVTLGDVLDAVCDSFLFNAPRLPPSEREDEDDDEDT